MLPTFLHKSLNVFLYGIGSLIFQTGIRVFFNCSKTYLTTEMFLQPNISTSLRRFPVRYLFNKIHAKSILKFGLFLVSSKAIQWLF